MARLSEAQLRCLSDASACAGSRGLERSGARWYPSWRYGPGAGHDHNTVRSLVDRGLLRLYVRGTVAHATDIGREVLADYQERQERRSR